VAAAWDLVAMVAAVLREAQTTLASALEALLDGIVRLRRMYAPCGTHVAMEQNALQRLGIPFTAAVLLASLAKHVTLCLTFHQMWVSRGMVMWNWSDPCNLTLTKRLRK